MKRLTISIIISLLILAVIPGDTPRPASGRAQWVDKSPAAPGNIHDDKPDPHLICNVRDGVLGCIYDPNEFYPAPEK